MRRAAVLDGCCGGSVAGSQHCGWNRILRAQISQSDDFPKRGRKGGGRDFAGLCFAGVYLSSARERNVPFDFQPGEQPVDVTARPDALNDLLTDVAAFCEMYAMHLAGFLRQRSR